MFKLLTEEGRDKVRREYRTRRTILMLLALILVLVAGVVGLLPSYMLSNIREKEALERVKILSNANIGSENGVELQTWFLETNRRLKALSPVLDTDRPSNFIDKVLEQKVTGIKITGLSWVKAKDKTNLSVSGVADDRQRLVMFEGKISSSGYFSNVTLPISDLAKDRNITFQIKFSPI